MEMFGVGKGEKERKDDDTSYFFFRWSRKRIVVGS